MRLKLVLALVIAGGFASYTLADDDDFPAFSRPTNFDLSPIEQMRSGAADHLQARGFKVSADEIRANSADPLQPFYKALIEARSAKAKSGKPASDRHPASYPTLLLHVL